MTGPVASSQLRQGRMDDAARIAALQQRTFDQSWSAESMRDLLKMPGALALLVDDPGGGVIGFLIARQAADTAEIITLAVDPAHRRCGWATVLLDGLERLVRHIDGARVVLDVAADNEAARALYDRLGYRAVARRAQYYAMGRPAPVDAIVMQKVAGSGPV